LQVIRTFLRNVLFEVRLEEAYPKKNAKHLHFHGAKDSILYFIEARRFPFASFARSHTSRPSQAKLCLLS
ncbi:hypothetical protein CLOM_g11506, partial [Closterium sp. NIES-68]